MPVKSKVEILQNFVAFSEYMNFTKQKGHVLYESAAVYSNKKEYAIKYVTTLPFFGT